MEICMLVIGLVLQSVERKAVCAEMSMVCRQVEKSDDGPEASGVREAN
jgi:hypothetical protein